MDTLRDRWPFLATPDASPVTGGNYTSDPLTEAALA
jgi:hypothetical protein